MTPKIMNTMKWSLLINYSWATWFVFGMCTLSTPYMFLPTTSYFGVGILSSLGLPYIPQVAMGYFSALCFASSYLYLFESRSNVLTDNRFRMTRKCTRTVYHALVFFINLTMFLFLISFMTTEESEKLEALKIDPCPTREFFQYPIVFVLPDPEMRNAVMKFWGPAILFQMSGNLWFHISCTVYYLFIAPPSRSISAETRRAQRQFFIGIIIQASIPALTLLIPPLALVVLVFTDNYSQEYMNLSVILFGLNGVIESMAILSVYRPYRNAVKEILNFRKSKEPKIRTVPVRGISSSI
ncbi:unnamed protein product [Caenorhabditis nigoni]